ncbi:bcl-2-associated transcription factor 1-like isoform X1 [Erpetoichthys calabaricus]|uniref:BCL2 associated transcription factor 1 n=1 Tax=Erpetoichthys calabaricus TaxID=27687 RepID=A0A8C4XAU9_ERPCA|nr:bcl-2-associated transcription factor 1-like isoform X1 [Erpetoichthys calabaricus]
MKMVRSDSRSHSSRSRSGSHSSSRSRSRSRSRKKRYSSRSRSRSYSRSRSRERERNYPRDYRRDYRMNRGMRRPYGFRGRGRGYYQGGGRFYHRGGFRPNWHNRRYSRSPRRGRSRSRTPKRRSTSQRSRSKSRHSERSSVSRRSSTSRSSSFYSQSPVPRKKRSSQDKPVKKLEGNVAKDEVDRRNSEEEKGNNNKSEQVTASSSKSMSDSKGTTNVTESWIGIAEYNDNSPHSHHSPSPIPTLPSQSSSRSDTASHQIASKISPASLPSQHLHSIQHSPDGSLDRYSPSQESPPYRSSPSSSPAPLFAVAQSGRGSFPNSEEQDLPKLGKYIKRYTDEEGSRAYLHERASGRDKDLQKGRTEREGEWAQSGGPDPVTKKEGEKVPFLGDSPDAEDDEEEDESQAYRQPYQFKVSSQVEQVKSYSTETRWNVGSQEEGGKYKIKTASKGEREYEKFGEDRVFKFKDPSYTVDKLGASKEKYMEKGGENYDERIAAKKEPASPQSKTEKVRDLYDHSPLLQKTLDMRDKGTFQDESPSRAKIVPGETCRPEVKMKISAAAFIDPSPGTSISSDRTLASALVHSTKKEQGFRSIFDHIKKPQSYKNSAESFIQHIVSLVHHVKEHYFKSTGMTLHERFTVYQKGGDGHEVKQKSPEIHRRIDISPSAFRKERVSKEESHKGDKKSRCDSADLRHDIDRRRKERSRERDPSPSRKMDKMGKDLKDYKGYKSYKDDGKRKSTERDNSRSSSSSSSSSSKEDKDSRKEREEEYKSHHEQKEYLGYQGGNRARGAFQFRIRGGRGRGRGVFTGPSPGPSNLNVPFQKRTKEEEWDPEYTPKSKKYFLHDDRDDGVDYWAKRGRGRGTFQRGRGRFTFKKSGSSPKWTHDKYQCEGNVEEEDEDVENNEERKDKRKEEKE